jgi:hypothetical protein
MAAALVHAVAAPRLSCPGQRVRAFHTLASAPALRSPSSFRRRIGVSLRAVALGPRGLVGGDHVPRGRRVVAALAGEEVLVSQLSLRDPCGCCFVCLSDLPNNFSYALVY